MGSCCGRCLLSERVRVLKNNAGEYGGITPPWWSDSEKTQTRYCVDKLWSNKTLTTYNIMMEVAPAFEIYNEAGKVSFDPPKMLYFGCLIRQYGIDREKTCVQYGDFGTAVFPGVLDINTGEKPGQC